MSLPLQASNKSNFVHNKVFTNTNNIKTKLCNNMKDGKICPFGEKCRFAHSESEIRKAPCVFQKNCKNPNCPYSHDANEELAKIIDKVEDKLSKIALIEKETKDLVIHLEEDKENIECVPVVLTETKEETIEGMNTSFATENEDTQEEDSKKENKMEIDFEDEYYKDVANKINKEEETVYNYMKTYDQEIKTINNYTLDLTMDEYSFKKLIFYLNSINSKYTYKKN